MTERRSSWTEGPGPLLPAVLAALTALAGPAVVTAQDDLDAACAASISPEECALAAGAVRLVHPRVGLVLWGGNAEPGTAGTLGLRRRATPRIGVSVRTALAPVTVPPVTDRTETRGRRGLLGAAAVQASLGIVHGTSPLPGVGGFLSLDFMGRLAHARLPAGRGFEDRAVWGLAGGFRLGIARESLLVPGVAVSALYGRSTTVTVGDMERGTTDGAARGAVSGLRLGATVSQRLFGLRLAAGVSRDRYASDADVRYTPAAGVGGALQLTGSGNAVTERWSA